MRHNQKTIIQFVNKKFKIIIPRDNTYEVDSSQCVFQQCIQLLKCSCWNTGIDPVVDKYGICTGVTVPKTVGDRGGGW